MEQRLTGQHAEDLLIKWHPLLEEIFLSYYGVTGDVILKFRGNGARAVVSPDTCNILKRIEMEAGWRAQYVEM